VLVVVVALGLPVVHKIDDENDDEDDQDVKTLRLGILQAQERCLVPPDNRIAPKEPNDRGHREIGAEWDPGGSLAFSQGDRCDTEGSP
jgi:hypothetical protein